MSRDGAASLDGALAAVLGQNIFVLERLALEGKKRLVVSPHESLHFFPFHLATLAGEPLASRFAVTTVPNLALLARDLDGVAPARSAELTTVGVGFERAGPFAVSPIPDAVEEAREVAAVFGASVLLDGDATESNVIDALGASRRLHVATHGQHNETAPSFQRLFLMPGDRDDGILHAFELLGLDLRGVELISLSACETALGRFDVADNLRGIPANLLLRGARAIVGTLWPVETRASRFFFTALYSQIRAGRSQIDSFWHAQQDTRERFPQYRDWGAFYYSGT